MLLLILLGRFQATYDNQPLPGFRTNKVQGLLIYLVAEPHSHTRESIMDLFWPNMPLHAARHNLRQVLYYLRRMFSQGQLHNEGNNGEATIVLSDRRKIQLNPEANVTADIHQFLSLNKRVQHHKHPDLLHCAACLRDLEEATALYQGDFLTDFFLTDSSPFETWASARRTEFQRQYLGALETLGRIYIVHGQFKEAEEVIRKQTAVDDLREEGQRQLLELLARTGRRNEAFVQYDELRQRLWDELGVAPEAETVDLVKQIERGELKESPVSAESETTMVLPGQVKKLKRLPQFLTEDATADESPTTFVARERELSQLQAALESARDGSGQVIFVIGGAGRGKTTLMQEFVRRAASSIPDLVSVTGFCAAITGTSDPYLPFREALAVLTGDIEAKWAAGLITHQQAKRLWELMPLTLSVLVKHAPNLINSLLSGSALQERAVSWAHRDNPWLLELASLSESKQRTGVDERRIFAEYSAFLKAVAEKRPLLLIIEDLHWVDTASSALLYYLSREIGDSKILLAGTYRPEEVALSRIVNLVTGHVEQHPLATVVSELKRQHGDIWLDLGELTGTIGRHFVNAYLDTQPNQLGKPFREALFRQTGGHALFTVELLRAMQDRGDLQQDEHGRWVEGKAVEWTTLPPKVEGAIEHRITPLDEDLQSILTTASVEGELFTAEVLARVLQLDQRRLVQQLGRELDKRHRLITVHAVEWLNSGRQRISKYQFRHQLFQQFLYNRLDEVERAYLHEAVANELEQLYAGQTEEVAGRLAYHFEIAGRREKVIEYRRLAAQRAVAVYAHDEAIHQLQKALDLLETDEQVEIQVDLLEELADVHSLRPTDSEAISHYQTALELWSTMTDANHMIGVRLHRKILEFAFRLYGNVHYEIYERVSKTVENSRVYLENRLPTVQDNKTQLEWVRVLTALANVIATVFRSPEDLETAENFAQAAVKLAEHLDAAEELTDALEVLGGIHYVRGRLPDQLQVSRRRLILSQDRRFTDLPRKNRILESLSDALIVSGEYDQANLYLSELGDLTRKIGAVSDHVWALALQGLCLFHLDQWERLFGIEEKRQALERRYSDVQLGGGHCVILSLSAAARALHGDFDVAQAQRDQASAFMLGSAEGPSDDWGRGEFY